MKIRQGTALTCVTTEREKIMERKEREEYKPLTHEELVAEAIRMIQSMNAEQIRVALAKALEKK